MSTFTNFHTWATGETMTAALLNGITNSLVTAGNAIDRTNLTAGAGIDASQIKPSSGAAGTFGGSVAYTFPLSLVTTVGSNSVVPLTIQGNAGGGQTGDLLDVLLQPAGTNFFKITAAGNIVSAGPLNQFASTGDLQIAPLINSINQLSRVAPCYTNSGAAVGATLHMVTGTTATLSLGTAATITLTNNAVFTSASTYAVFASINDNSGPGASSNAGYSINNVSGTSFQLKNNDTGGSSHAYTWFAIGT